MPISMQQPRTLTSSGAVRVPTRTCLSHYSAAGSMIARPPVTGRACPSPSIVAVRACQQIEGGHVGAYVPHGCAPGGRGWGSTTLVSSLVP